MFSRNFAKEAVNLTVATVLTKVTADAIVEHTNHEEDEISVRIVSGMTGWAIAGALRERTDEMVDKIADWRERRVLAKAAEEVNAIS